MKQTMACGGCGHSLHRVFAVPLNDGAVGYKALILECAACKSQTRIMPAEPRIVTDWVDAGQLGTLAIMPHKDL